MAMWILLWCSLAAAELVGLVQISRHGLRTPIKVFPWAYEEAESPGELTAAGAEQQFAHGVSLRHNYSSLFAGADFQRDVYARATGFQRTVASIQSQLRGIFSVNETFPVVTKGKPEDELLLPIFSCPRILQVLNTTMVRRPRHAALMQRIALLGPELLQYTHSLEALEVFHVGEVLMNYQDRGLQSPCSQEVTHVAKEMYEHWNSYLLFGTEEQQVLGASMLFVQVFTAFADILQAKNVPRIYFFGGHDISLIPVLKLLDIYEAPEIGAFLLIELHKTEDTAYLRFLLNGNQRLIPSCPEPCEFQTFQKIWSRRICTDYDEWSYHCQVTTDYASGTVLCVLLLVIIVPPAVFIGLRRKRRDKKKTN